MKRSLVNVVFVLLVTTFAVPQAFGQKAHTSLEEAIRTADQQWLKVFAAGDLEKSVEFCTDDGSILGPNQPIATGKEAIKKSFSAFFGIPGFKISWQPLRTEVAKSGELGVTSGAYQMTFNGPAGKLITDQGKYVTVWKKQADGSWKVFLDIFNSDLPAPAL